MAFALECLLLGAKKRSPAEESGAEKSFLHKNVFKMGLLDNIVRNSFIYMVKLYRAVFSPFFGSNCRFHPTCSQYCIEAFESLPITRALLLSVIRIVRCNPFSSGGPDPVQK